MFLLVSIVGSAYGAKPKTIIVKSQEIIIPFDELKSAEHYGKTLTTTAFIAMASVVALLFSNINA